MACDSSRALVVVSGMAFEAAIAQGAAIRTTYGLNSPKLAEDIEQAISQGAAGVLSFGVAAGLMPSLSSGSIVIARQVRSQQQVFAADEAWAQELCRQLPDATHADIAGVDHPIAGVVEKSSLWAQSGAAAADMESHLAARLARQNNLPFAALRVVLDGAGRALPPAALAATRPDGTMNIVGLFASLLAHPLQLPALMRLAGDQAVAKKTLLRCGDLLKGSRFGLVNLG